MSDIVVIGGGIAGLSAAAFLSDLGSVTVLEAEAALGYHTSGRSAALWEESYGAPPVVALNRASHPYLLEGGYLSPRGLMVISTAETAAAFDVDMLAMHLWPMNRDEMLAKVPILDPAVVTRGGWHEAALDIDTDRLLQDFARRVRGNGGTVRTQASVTAIRRAASGWVVTAGGDDMPARLLVNAAGAWADAVAVMAGIAPLGLQPMRRSMARIAAPGGRDVSGWPMMFGAGEAWYAKPDAGALLISPADEDPAEPHDAWPDDLVLAEGLARYQACVTEEVTRPIATWAGLRTFAPDRVLVLGPEPACPDFIWAAGQGGYGFQTSAAAGRLMADLVGGRVSDLPADAVAALRPDRLRR